MNRPVRPTPDFVRESEVNENAKNKLFLIIDEFEELFFVYSLTDDILQAHADNLVTVVDVNTKRRLVDNKWKKIDIK